MVVGDGQDVIFLATDSSHPLPSCLNSTNGAWYGTKNSMTAERNPSIMKTPGNFNTSNTLCVLF